MRDPMLFDEETYLESADGRCDMILRILLKANNDLIYD